MSKIINFFQETKNELKYVSWPTQKQTIIFTIMVICISLFTAIYLGFFDFIFSKLIIKFLLQI
jgi:preprotein translocase SecE subunit